MSGSVYSALLVAVMSFATIFLRALPFAVFRDPSKTPKYVLWLGEVLPKAVIGMLVVYCLRNVSVTSGSFGIPELCACAGVILLQTWKHNSLASILGGTLLYMVLIQVFF